MKTGTGPSYGKPSFRPKTVSDSKTRKGTLQLTASPTKKSIRAKDQYGVC